MGVTRRETLRRWSVVSAGVAVLCLLPAAVAAWPVGPATAVAPDELRDRILASAGQPYQGYVETNGRLGLPPLRPWLTELVGPLGGTTKIRAWYADPRSWRVAELATVGERDTYRTRTGLYRWDFERSQVTLVATRLGDEQLVWPAGAADLVPPTLGRRLLAAEGRLEPLPSRRVAGQTTAGVRLIIADPGTTVGQVDVWADPETGLPVRVEVTGRGDARPAYTSRFLDLRQAAPDPATLTPQFGDRVNVAVTSAEQLNDELANLVPESQLPDRLAGRARAYWAGPLGVVAGSYGTGLSTMVVVPLPGRVGGELLGSGRDAGGTLAPIAEAEAYQLRSSLLTALVVHADHDEEGRGMLHSWLLVGLVEPQVLHQAAADLVADFHDRVADAS